MKKKYLALLLACFMIAPLALSSCGRLADEIVEEDEEEEDDDEDEEEEDDGPVYVEVIDDSDLKDQIKVLVKNRDKWVGNYVGSASVDTYGYMVTDLDHNGRLEIVENTVFEYDGYTEMHIYEVDEDTKGIKEAKWKWKGIDISSDKYPEPESCVSYFYDKKKEVTRYQFENYYDNGNNEYGMAYIDLTYSEGKAECNTVAATMMESDWVFYTDDDADIDDIDDFLDYVDSYHDKYDLEWVEFGIFTESASSGSGLSEADEDELKTLLTDSYKVFSGEMDSLEFEELYVVPSENTDDMYEQLIGKWDVYSIDDQYGTEYYDQDSSERLSFEFFDDYTVLMTMYLDDELYLSELLDVSYEVGLYPIIEYYVDDDDDTAYVQFFITEISEDGQSFDVLVMSYSADGYIEDSWEAVFVKDKYYNPSYAEDYKRAVGEWELYSSELEGDITYYSENGNMYATLSVYEDFTVSMKEYSNGSVFLEINESVYRNSYGSPAFDYSDEDAHNSTVALETYSFSSISEDNNTLEISLDFYDKNGEWLGYTILTFNRT